MKKVLVKFDNTKFYAPTGLGKSEYITILNDDNIFDMNYIKIFSDYLNNIENYNNENEFIENHLQQIGDLCKRISNHLKLEILDNFCRKIPENCFILLSLEIFNNIYSFKNQFIVALKQEMPYLEMKINDDGLIANSNKPKQTPVNQNLMRNIDIDYLEDSIEVKKKEIEQTYKKIQQLKNQPIQEDLEQKIQEIEKNTQLLVFRRTQCEIEIENVIAKLTDVTGEEKKALYKKNKDFIEEINQLVEKISEQEHKIGVLKKANLNDSNNSEIIRLESVILGLEESIKGIENEIIRINQNEIKILSNTASNIPTNKILLKNHQKRVSIDSQYINLPYNFEITNVNYITKSKSDFKSIYAVIFNILTRGKRIKPNHLKGKHSDDELEKIYQLQILVLMLLRNGILNDSLWSFQIDDEYKSSLDAAIEDILYWIEQITSLTKMYFDRPLINYDKNDCIVILFDDYSIDESTFCINMTTSKSDVIPIWIENRIDYSINPNNQNHRFVMEQILQTLFDFPSFREGQLEIISNFLKYKNTLGILTTGGGKSLTYYLSVLLQPKISLIIAPINSLIKDQTDNLNQRYGIDRFAILTGDNKNKNEDLERFKKAQTLFTFASPERIQNNRFRQILIDHSYSKIIGSVILDEVHCLSEWGHDFRVPYLMLSTTLNTYCEGVSYLGLTATASVNVVRDLMIELNIKEDDVIYSTHLKRPNLRFSIKRCVNSVQAISELKILLRNHYRKKTDLDIYKYNDQVNSIIVFSRTKGGSTGVEALYRDFNNEFPDHVGLYHGDKKEEQDAFMTDEYPLLFATKAFGMGIDKPNVRATFHFGMPESREAYYQEAGRSGRDGKNAECMLLSYTSSNYDPLINQFFNPNTSIDRQQSIMGMLKGTDISTNLYFYLQDIESLDDEIDQSLELYDRLQEHKNYIYDLSNDSKNKTEKYLYILHKIGIVKNWEVTFYGLANISFKVEVNPFFEDIGHIKKSSLFYIHAYSEQFSMQDNELERDRYYRNKIENVKSIQDIDAIIRAIREWYYFTFTTTRRVKLENMYRLVSDTSNHDKIQDVLETAFDISQTIGKTKEGYSLSFESNTLGEVMSFAFQLEKSMIENRIIAVEHLLESLTSNKVRLYLAILLLRAQKPNAGDIITDIYRTLSHDEKITFTHSITDNYHTLNQEQRVELFNIMESIDSQALRKICKSIDMDEVVYIYVTNQLKNILGEGW